MTLIPLARALNEGLRAAMNDNEKVLMLGEDIGTLGGVSASLTNCRPSSAPPACLILRLPRLASWATRLVWR